MLRRLVSSMVGAVLVAVLLLGVPLAVVGARLIHDGAQHRVAREAQSVALAIEDRIEHHEAITAQRLQHLTPKGYHVSVLTRGGQLVQAGSTVPAPTITQTANVNEGGQVTLTAPAAGVRAETIRDEVVVGVLALLSAAIAAFVATLLARRLTGPLVELAEVAGRLGAGDTRPHPRRYGISELDRVADVLDVSGTRLATLLRREREFAADASHQLRTPLTALSMRLEEIARTGDEQSAREARAALSQVERMTDAVRTLLDESRRSRAEDAVPVDLTEVVRDQVAEWEPAYARAGRSIRVVAPRPVPALATPGALGQAVASLLDNGLVHGSGQLTVRVQRSGGFGVVEVSDEGPGVPAALAPRIFERSVSGGSGTGLGLALARALVDADGGRLELVRQRPPLFAIFLPEEATTRSFAPPPPPTLAPTRPDLARGTPTA